MKINFISPLILSIGILGAGFLLSNSINNYRNFDRYVDVKGLDEKIVKANVATWIISFTSANNDLKQIYANVSSSQNSVIQFLIAQGFKDTEIQKQTVSVNDAQTNSYSQNVNLPRYSANSGIVITTSNVDLISQAVQKTGSLVESGVVVNNSFVKYSYTDLNSIKPEMLTRATASAREAAETFAKNSNSAIGKIKRASQGTFSITSVTSDSYGDDSSIMKKVRVVTSVEFFIK